MTLLDVIAKRYSCRDYRDRDIEPDKLDKLFEAARLAPSAKNLQDWRFVLVREKQIKQQVAECTNRPEIFGKAPLIIVACSNSDEIMRCGQHVGPIDVAIALEHIALTAVELGLATCWIGSFDTPKVRRLLDIPPAVAIIELMVVGYPANGRRRTTREPIGNILCYDKWLF